MHWNLAVARDRRVAYAALGLVMLALLLLAIPFKQRLNFIVSDGRGYYVYLPSVVIDGDLDFENQIREHWDVDAHPWRLASRTARGYVQNCYPVGMALSLAPPFLAAHGLSELLYPLTGSPRLAPDGYSALYQFFTLGAILAYAVASLCLVDYLLVDALGVDPRAAGAAVLLYWVGSPYLYYTCREPFMAHAVSGFWVNLCVVLLVRLHRRAVAGAALGAFCLPALAFASSMAIVCRPTNAFLLPFYLFVLSEIVRARRLGAFLLALPASLPGLFPIAAQMAVWYVMTGRVVYFSYEGATFHWTHPMAWQTLLSSRHGLFFWSPLLAVGFVGLVGRLSRRPHPFLVCLAASLVILWYCNASWCVWSFGDSFGGRAYLELAAAFVAGLASVFEWWAKAGRRTWAAGCAVVAACLVYQGVLMVLYVSHGIPRDDYLISGW